MAKSIERSILPFTGARSLRRRLTLLYTAALSVGLLIFALVSLAAIDRTLKQTLDARLATNARALAAIAAHHVTARKVDPATVRRLIASLGIQQNCAIFTRDGTIAMESAVVPASIAQLARNTASGELTFATVPNEGGLRVAVLPLTSGRADGPAVVLWRPIDVIGDYEGAAVSILAVASLVIIAGAFLAGGLIVQRGLRPLRSIAGVASEIEANDITRRLNNDTWDDELRELATTFDRMLDRLQSAFERQRQFTADASHDLRAPLAVIRAEVDLALARPRRRDADNASFHSIRDEVREFDRLLEALLLAARADAGPVNAAVIDLFDLAARAVARLRPFAASRCVRMTIDVPSSTFIVGDADILERVLVSLLHNAIKFTPANGAVLLCALSANRTVALIVRDQGPGFSAEALQHAFDRFWKDDAARGRSGTGLGLAIAKSAVERIGGKIRIRNARAGGAEIETEFPLAPG